MKNDNSPAAVYERFKLEWMLTHGYTLQHLVAELEKLRAENKLLKAQNKRQEMEMAFLKKLGEIERRRF